MAALLTACGGGSDSQTLEEEVEAEFPLSATQSAWAGVAKALPTTPQGNVVSVSSHNCYAYQRPTAQQNLAETLAMVHAAQAENFDQISLDIVFNGQNVLLNHDDDGATERARLVDVLSDAALRGGNQMLGIEFKESDRSPGAVRALLTMLKTLGYAKPGRSVSLYALTGARLENVLEARQQLAGEFSAIRPYVKLGALHGTKATPADYQQSLRALKAAGLDGVLFPLKTRSLLGVLTYARQLGLLVGVYPIPDADGGVVLGSLRNEVDMVSTDGTYAAARTSISGHASLAYLNTSSQTRTTDSVRVYGASTNTVVRSLGAPTAPRLLVEGAGEDRFGGYLFFRAAQRQRLPLFDVEPRAGAGLIVTAAVNFDKLALDRGERQTIVSKAEQGGFLLEAANPTGTASVLRFCVYVSGAYRCATAPMSGLDESQLYFVTGAHDAQTGRVSLWVNFDNRATTSPPKVIGEMGPNNAPIMVGAEPQGTDARYFWSGKLQQLTIQTLR